MSCGHSAGCERDAQALVQSAPSRPKVQLRPTDRARHKQWVDVTDAQIKVSLLQLK